ncbi:MAG: hypothetical protein JWQ18_1420 [Conexibacter sp.]|nr:hypothetical protein [Conexibacter sp.]
MRRRLAFLLATALAVVAGVASASALSSGGSDTLNGPEAIQPDGRGAAIPATIADPDGRAAWAVRVYRSQAGLTCPEAGRTKDGNFGQVDDDGDFRSLDIEAAGSCTDLAKAPMSLAVNHYPTSGKLPARAVVFGVATPKISGLTLNLASGSRALAIRSGAFIAVAREDALQGASLVATLADGTSTSYALQPLDAPATGTGTEDPATG